MHKEYEVIKAKAHPLGVCFQQEGLHIAAVCTNQPGSKDSDEFGIILYDRKHKDGIRIPFPKESRVGDAYGMLLKGYHDRTCSYLLCCGDQVWQDPYCKRLENASKYGVPRVTMPRCMVQDTDYDWESDRALELPYEDMVIYALHVRGFTKHRSSGVKYKGTYLGITEKISYLKELGITSLLLMPAYEFDEVMAQESIQKPMTMEQAVASYRQPLPQTGAGSSDVLPEESACKVNYWGYQKGLYYIPKSGYAYGKDAATEYRDMVKTLHTNGIEVMMQFYFPAEIGAAQMLEILKYWVLEYHIDGFHVMGVDLPIGMFAKEPFLSRTKILTTQQYSPVSTDYMALPRRIGLLDEGFMYDMRRALKSDDNMINPLLFRVRNNCSETGCINYIAKWDGMRLADLVSYDHKHNEMNGEDNRDGTDYNCSWNCGVEGKSRRKNITDLRLRQMKNALTLVFLSQGTPLLYSGDEFGNSQEGNNNPYCQDNAVGWVKWNYSAEGRELFQYTKMLVALRREHPVLHSGEPLKGMDYLSCGYPDISFHGKEAWRPEASPAVRSVGIMYCGYYGVTEGHRDDTLFYIGINLHWKTRSLGLPQLPKGKTWTLYASTKPEEKPGGGEPEEACLEKETSDTLQEIDISPRTVVIYMVQGCKEAASDYGKGKKGRYE